LSTNNKSTLVEIVNYAFLQKLFSHESKKDLDIIDKISSQFSLNEEQKRAYHIIITQHVISKTPVKLRMYLGGMGGTGKSQVSKALMCFFDQKGELHRFITVAPTGSAAAIIGGSTYHSIFGIYENSNSKKTLGEVKARLEGVNYIFLDEVSILSCQDMYKISAQLSKALNVFDKPINIFRILTILFELIVLFSLLAKL
jgi:PIF1-like helicase